MLLFEVKQQKLTRLDAVEPATDSEQYLKAKFTFNDADWNGKTKTALFRLGDVVYKAVLNSNNECVVPSEVLVRDSGRYARTQGSKIYVSLIGELNTTRITTNELCVVLNTSGYTDALTPQNPTESEYQQIITQYANNQAECEAAREELQTAEVELKGVKNIFANAIKGNLSGTVVFADDVSPIEHNPVVKVHGKNLIDYTKACPRISTNTIVIDESDNSIIFSGNYYFKIPVSIDKGKTVVFSCVSDNFEGYWVFEYEDGTLSVHTAKESRTAEKHVKNILIYKSNSTVTEENIVFKNLQLEEGTTATEYEPYIDPSTVTVTRCGKSIFSKSSQVVSGVSKPWTSLLLCAVKVPAGNYVASCNFKQQGQDISRVAISVRDYEDYTVAFGDDSNTEKSGYLEKAFTVPNGSNGFQIYLYSNQPNEALTTECLFENIQVELGQIATIYESYNGTQHTPSADGTVEGITSLSPNMTILTDTSGVIVECEYIKDTTKVLQKFADALNITI